MKKIFLRLMGVLFILNFTSCQKQNYDLSSHTARGKIIAITNSCELEKVAIEVESPEGLGESGSYYTYSETNKDYQWFEYKNAIAVPYFSKIGLPVDKQKIGTILTFKYRELNKTEYSLFEPKNKEAMICPAVAFSPFGNVFIITEIIK